MIGGFPSQKASYAESVSMQWRHHELYKTAQTEYQIGKHHIHIQELRLHKEL